MASSFSTPKKPMSDVCRICGTNFSRHKRDKMNLFRNVEGLHLILQEATGQAVSEDDGLPHTVCTSCRNILVRYERTRKQAEEARLFIREKSAGTAAFCRFKRRFRESPASPAHQQKTKSLHQARSQKIADRAHYRGRYA